MSCNLIFSFVFMITLVSGQFGDKGTSAETDGGVLVLNEKNFFMEGLMKPYLLVEFYAPWCQHCQKMEPVYSDAAKLLQQHSPMLHIAKVNTDENKNLQAEYGIQSFPTFIVFKNGNYLKPYDGLMTAKGFYNDVVKGNHGEDQETDCKTITKMKKKAGQFTIVYFGPKDHPFYEGIYKPFFEFIQNDEADQKRRYHIRHNNDPKCATEMQVEYPSIMWYKDFEEKLNIYGGDQEPTFEAFHKWSFNHIAPIPFKLSEYADTTMGLGYPVMILFRSEGQKDEDFAAEFHDAAIENNGTRQILFAWTTLDDEYSERLAKHFDFDRHQLPQLRISGGGLKFKPEKFSTKNATSTLVLEWLDDVMTAKSTGYARVQKEPKYNDGAIKILNTNSIFDFLDVKDTAKIILMYKPDNKQLDLYMRPIIWQIVEEFQAAGLTGEGKIIFGEFNRLENENEEFPSDRTIDFFYFGEDMSTVVQFSKQPDIKVLDRETIKPWMESVSKHLQVSENSLENKEDNSNSQKAEEGVKSEL